MNMLVRPSPLPEELDRGYLGFIRRINGLANERETVNAMAQHFGLEHKKRQELPCVELLAMMANQPIEQFVQSHTTLPLRRAITSYFPDLPHGSTTRRSILFVSAMVAARPGAYFCEACALADQDFHGVSYWRRDHQIPGQLWCPKHRTPFRYIKKDSAFLQSPMTFMDSALTLPSDWVTESIDNAYVGRFLDIASGLMLHPMPLDVRSVALKLRTKAKTLELKVGGDAGKAQLLNDLIQRLFPTRWLAAVCPAFIKKIDGKKRNSADSLLFMNGTASSVWPYILISAVLFESADQALNALLRSRDASPERQPRKAISNNALDIAELTKAYVSCEGSHAATSESVGVSKFVVSRRLVAAGLPDLMPSRGKNRRRAATAFYVDQMSISDSAATGGLTNAEMELLVRGGSPNLAAALSEMTSPLSGKGCRKRSRAPSPGEFDALTSGPSPMPTLVRQPAVEVTPYFPPVESQN